ncbi:MAG: hypothetical protein E6X92_13255, partial [Clostridiaceae bacterium]|nr:hypothetical protein [Clostridiaceae bacterium]
RSGLTLQRSQSYRLGTAVLPKKDNAEMYSAQDEGPVRCFGSLLAKRISTKSIHSLWMLLRPHIIL